MNACDASRPYKQGRVTQRDDPTTKGEETRTKEGEGRTTKRVYISRISFGGLRDLKRVARSLFATFKGGPLVELVARMPRNQAICDASFSCNFSDKIPWFIPAAEAASRELLGGAELGPSAVAPTPTVRPLNRDSSPW